MLGFAWWRQLSLLGLSVLWLLLSLPALLGPKAAAFLPAWLAEKTLTLGLDLRGGVHLLLEVDQKKLVSDYYAHVLGSLRRQMRAKSLHYLGLSSSEKGISFEVLDQVSEQEIMNVVLAADNTMNVSLKGRRVRVFLNEEAKRALLLSAQEKSIETVRRRVDETGTKEPVIQAQGDQRILLQIPGADDPVRVKELVGTTARLTFHIVKNVFDWQTAKGMVPELGTEILPDFNPKTVEDEAPARRFGYLVDKEVMLSGDMLVDAQPGFDEYNRPRVEFVFNALGADIFGNATKAHTGQPFAIVLDGRVISAPQIKEPILGGRGVIQGHFSVKEAQDLSLLMRSGALPAPLTVVEERVIGPGLGSDSIRLGTTATVIAVFVVMALMFLAYAFFGTFANVALVLNLLLLLGSMAFLGATLTLPGIAGIALTLGMAVDANVLINERIKEELRLGRRLLPAIDFGYQRAMTTIVDSNMTTLIGAFILYICGTGPVRGFAVTLSLGILISMFTAVTLTRVFISLWLQWLKPKALWI
ncbi:MAG: protein translocase subunit SecD [Holosporaceae bacterium]